MSATSGSVICGNPTTPCSGKGFCEIQKTAINSELAINDVSVCVYGPDVIITFTPAQLQKLQTVRSDIYNDLVNNHQFHFGQGALPFYLDYYVCKNLWPEGPHYNRIESGNCSVGVLPDGSATITIPVTMNDDGRVYGSAGSIDGTPLKSGEWKIGTDVYGNLLFQNGINAVAFGANGNVSNNKYSVVHSQAVMSTGNQNTSEQLCKNWLYGEDSEGHLFINNGLNNIVFHGNINAITINGLTVETQPALPQPEVPFDIAGRCFYAGAWTFGTDMTGNLCFKSPQTSYSFGKMQGIYVGLQHTVKTSLPGGGNMPIL